MKIAILGAGAIGSTVGGLFSEAGEDVTLIGRKSHVDAIRRNGLVLETASGTRVIRVKAAEDLDFRPELVLLTVKSQDIVSTVQRAKPFLSGVPLVTMQNGVRSDDLVAGVLGRENIVSSVVVFSGSFLEPGKVSYSGLLSSTVLLLGDPFAANASRLQTLLAIFNRALPTDPSENIRGAHWTKLLWNLNTAVPAVTGLTYQEGARYSPVRKFYIGLMKEGLDVLNAAGIEPASVPGFPLDPMQEMAGKPLPAASRLAKSFFGKLPIYGSMYQSVKKRQKTEIDYLNGEVVSLGKKTGIPTPANSLMVDLLQEVETTGRFLTVPELTRRLGRRL